LVLLLNLICFLRSIFFSFLICKICLLLVSYLHELTLTLVSLSLSLWNSIHQIIRWWLTRSEFKLAIDILLRLIWVLSCQLFLVLQFALQFLNECWLGSNCVFILFNLFLKNLFFFDVIIDLLFLFLLQFLILVLFQ